MRHLAHSLAAALLAAVVAAGVASAQDAARGKALFELCAACHGPAGGGNADLGAPAIAGLSQWYVEAQLEKFKSGVRGAHPEDVTGMRMRPMSLTLARDGDVEAVAAWVAGLPATRPAPVLTGGDPARGKDLYAPCVACHGPAGQGNEQLFAPPLAHANDWYLLAQLEKFRAGIRGANPRDSTGILMRPMSLTLPDPQALKDVVAHITTLSQ